MRTTMFLLALAVVLGAAVVALPAASAGHCGTDVGCRVSGYVACARDALEHTPPQFWCEA